MHSSLFTAAAQAADEHLFKSIVAMADMPASQGTYPAAWVVAVDDDGVMGNVVSDKCSVHRVIFPDGRPPFFDCGEYDLSYPAAMARFAGLVEREVRRAA